MLCRAGGFICGPTLTAIAGWQPELGRCFELRRHSGRKSGSNLATTIGRRHWAKTGQSGSALRLFSNGRGGCWLVRHAATADDRREKLRRAIGISHGGRRLTRSAIARQRLAFGALPARAAMPIRDRSADGICARGDGMARRHSLDRATRPTGISSNDNR